MQTANPLLPLIGPRDHGVETRARLDTLTQELSSGRQADLGRALASDFSAVSQAAHALRTHDTRMAALSTAGSWLQTSQGALDAVRGAGARIGLGLPAATGPIDASRVEGLAGIARGALEDMTSALEVRVAGRAVFGNGDASPGPLIDLGALLAETGALAAGAGSMEELIEAFDAYFGTGGGVETNVLRAVPADPARFPLGEGASIDVPVSLADPAIRGALKQAAFFAALPQAGFPVAGGDGSGLAVKLTQQSLQTENDLVTTQGKLGAVQERVERRTSELSQRRTELEAVQADAVGADPFETATRLQNEMTRLETIYAVTARRAQLRLTDYLR